MSGSPKYHEMRSGEMRRQRAERERQERERRRREEERNRKEEALKRVVAAATGRVDETSRRLATLREDAAAAGILDRIEALDRQLATTLQAINSATSEMALRKAVGGVDRTDRGLADVRFQINQHKQRQEISDGIALVVDLLSTVPAQVRASYDRDGHDAAEEQLARARRQASSDPAGATKRLDVLTQFVNEHVDRVLARKHDHEGRVASATSVVNEISDRLAILDAESARTLIPLTAGPAAHSAVTALRDALQRGDLEAVHADAESATARVAQAEHELDALTDRIVERRQVLESIVAALPNTGFQVDAGSFREGADGALELRAHSTSGQGFAVLVRDNAAAQTEVLYTTDSMAGEIAAGTAGKSCGPLLEIIDRLSEEARNNGFEPGTVRWDDDPDRPPPTQQVALPHTPRRARGAS